MLAAAEIADLCGRTSCRAVAETLGAALDRRGAGPCPLCGGGKTSKRFEIIDHDKRWVCAACASGGDVIELVRQMLSVDFPAAVEWLGGTQKIDPAVAERREKERAESEAKREKASEAFREQERARLYQTWRAAPLFYGTPAETYLADRGVAYRDDLKLRFVAAAPYFEGEEEDETGRKSPRVIYRGPAMLAPLIDAGGVFRGLHFTWIDRSGPNGKAKIIHPETGEVLSSKKMRGHKTGCFIPLGCGAARMSLRCGEGIETTLSVREALRDGALYRAAGDLGNLAGPAIESVAHSTLKGPKGRPRRIPGPIPDLARPGMPVPDEIEDILWLGDGDSDPELTNYALQRAMARHEKSGRRQSPLMAPSGADWNDVLRGMAR